VNVRGRRLRKQSDDTIAFISSTASDERISAHVVRINMAHMVSLVSSGEVGRATGARCLDFLLNCSPRPDEASRAEDFHQQLEQEAVDTLGVKVAGYMNLGKSRNDQVAAAIRMELRRKVLELVGHMTTLQETLLGMAEKNGRILLPGYTHLQRAQPVTLAHYAFAHIEALQRDVDRLFQLFDRVNVSPMGSAALGGTSVKVDRRFVAKMLGFNGISGNAMDAVSSRDIVLEALSCAAILMVDISRMAEEQILWSSREFGFVELADEFSASSSIMPQKKNPVVAEISRAKAGSVIGRLVSVCSILKSLPYAYNLDLQEATPHLWSALDDAIDSVRLLGKSLSAMRFNTDVISSSIKGDYSTATALANYLVSAHSLSFREAHSMVGELVRTSYESGTPLEEVVARNLPEVAKRSGRRLAMDAGVVKSILDPGNFLASITTEGGANPRFIPKDVRRYAEAAGSNRERLGLAAAALNSSEKELLRISRSMAREVRDKK
jgi:argininosuccinate lyase